MSDVGFGVLNHSQCKAVLTFRLTMRSPYSQRMRPEGNVTHRITPDFHWETNMSAQTLAYEKFLSCLNKKQKTKKTKTKKRKFSHNSLRRTHCRLPDKDNFVVSSGPDPGQWRLTFVLRLEQNSGHSPQHCLDTMTHWLRDLRPQFYKCQPHWHWRCADSAPMAALQFVTAACAVTAAARNASVWSLLIHNLLQ